MADKKIDWLDTFLGFLSWYFRLEVSGLEHIPRTGPGIIVANHSGWMGLDAGLLAYIIRHRTGRRCRIMAHRGYFGWSRRLRKIALLNGLRKPQSEDARRILEKGHLLILFPEGEAGNFKSSTKRYQLQPFHKGFVHIAAASGAPVIPCAIVGSEEAQLNLGSVRMGLHRPFLRVPFPVPIPPLPSKWKIQFFESISPKQLTGYGATPFAQAAGVAESVRYELQERLATLRE